MRVRNIFLHLWVTVTHKAWVLWFCLGFCARLMARAVVHDLSKLGPAEASGFVRVIHLLKNSRYGSAEYKAALADIRPSVQLHYQRHSHHPEHYPRGVAGMSLLDVVEMWCDWRAAVRRHKHGNILSSIEINAKRHRLGVLAPILRNQAMAGSKGKGGE